MDGVEDRGSLAHKDFSRLENQSFLERLRMARDLVEGIDARCVGVQPVVELWDHMEEVDKADVLGICPLTDSARQRLPVM